MKVLLLADVKGQGKKNEVIEVSDGYGKNFLIPRKLAKLADAQSVNDAKTKESARLYRLETEGKPHGTCGIGHTRWATHGEPSDVNSHPIGNERVSIVHNGIIENYREIKKFLISKGYGFESETDTEVIVHLVEMYYSGDFKTAVGEAVVAELAPVQARYKELIADKNYLEECMKNGADLATRISQRTLNKVMKKIGFYTV